MKRFIWFALMISVFFILPLSVAQGDSIKCDFDCPDEAEIGGKITVSYKLTGGSGKYKNMYISIQSMAEIIGNGGVGLGIYEEEAIESPSGTRTFSVPGGTTGTISISGEDAETNEWFCLDKHIKLLPNSDYPITIITDKKQYYLGEQIKANYTIKGLKGPLENVDIWWAVSLEHSSPDLLQGNENTLSSLGTLSFTPTYGLSTVCFISATDQNGEPVFAQSDEIPLISIYDKLDCDFEAPDEAEIGKKITVSYKLTGGSGKYKNMHISIQSSANIIGVGGTGRGIYEEKAIESPNGTQTFSVPGGTSGTISVSGEDAETKEVFCFSKTIQLLPNSNYPITIVAERNKYHLGEKISINYTIKGLNESLQDVEIWWGLSREHFSPEMLPSNEQTLSSSGILTFTPTYGESTVCFISATTSDGTPVFAQSDELILFSKEHIEEIDRAVEPTIMSTGLTEGKHCSVCGIILVKQEVIPKAEPRTPEEKIMAYVIRCYQVILGREPDAGGLNTWVNELNSGRKAAAEIIEQFVASAEFQNKNLSNADAVEILYKAMLGRGSDPAGKADWVAKLDAGQHLTAVINGFCGSAEFKAICDSYGIQPGTVTVKDGTPVTPVADAEKIKAYVERCYQIILGRGADEGGLNTWMDELISGRKAAAEIIEQFVASAEFQNKNLSNSDAVEILYKAMLGRGSDAAGKADWVSKLDAGQDLTAVINGFCGSAEFKAICDSYGIQPGTVTVKQPTVPAANDEKIQAFVARCYKIILGRDADEGGMNTWFNELKSGRKAAAEIIESFVNSQEFKNKNYSNPDAVEILYKAMLGRGSDPAGKADWVEKLNAGQPLEAVINGFCGSAEFKAICDAYGITPGTVNVPQLSKMAVMQEVPAEKPVVKETVNNVTRVEITNASDTVNEQLGTAVQAIYINEEKAKEFIGRCYRVILGREAGAAELDGWISQMTDGSKTADQIARGFLFSGEFKGRNVSNEELVKILYRVYMNREADPEGLATWTQKLDEGTGLNDLLNVFAKTNEFKAVLKDMAE